MGNSKIECNICKASDHELIKKGVYGSEDRNVYRCHSCSHVYLAPLLSDEEEIQFYNKQYPAFCSGEETQKVLIPMNISQKTKNRLAKDSRA